MAHVDPELINHLPLIGIVIGILILRRLKKEGGLLIRGLHERLGFGVLP